VGGRRVVFAEAAVLAHHQERLVSVVAEAVWHCILLHSLRKFLVCDGEQGHLEQVVPMDWGGLLGASAIGSCGPCSCTERWSIWLKFIFIFG